MGKRVAFYPCCGADIEVPRSLLRGFVDEIFFCDIRSDLPILVAEAAQRSTDSGLPEIRPLLDDAIHILDHLGTIHVLFYRDGSNERGSWFRKMLRKAGFARYGWQFSTAEEQPLKEAKLSVIRVRRCAQSGL
jgi:hypothetical protein